MSIIGTRVERVEDRRFLTNGGTYTDDVRLDGCAVATFVRSTEPHARITGIDTSDAAASPGVLGVFTSADLTDLPPFAPRDMPIVTETFARPWLATDIVRYVGDPIAVVVAETLAQAQDAAERVVVSYDSLEAVVDPVVAASDTVVLHAAAGTNTCFVIPDEAASFDGCDVVVRARIVNQKIAVAPMEPQAGVARWTETGRLEMWVTSQGPHRLKGTLAELYALNPDQVRVVSPDVGGGFGGKSFPAPEQMLLPWLARRVGRPVKWTETRSESMLSIGPGRGQIQHLAIGGTRDGRVRGYDLDVLQDVGAYPRVSMMLPMLTRMMHPGTYDIASTKCRVRSVVTNTVPMGAFRGAGRPEAAAAIERAMDLFAAEIGMDPAEVRRKNLVGPERFPFTTSGGTVYDSGDYEKGLDLALDALGYADVRAEQQQRRATGDRVQLGIGFAVYVEVTALQGGVEYGKVEILPGGKARVLTGSFSHGQGHATGWAMIVADRTGIAVDDIEVLYGDTDIVPVGGMTAGSRSVQIAGTTVLRAANDVVDVAKQRAATLLEADPSDVVLNTDRGRFHVAGVPSVAKTWGDVEAAARADGQLLEAEGSFTLSPTGSYPSGTHIAVVEVDTETGMARVARMVAVDDAGRILNPLLAEGQVHGGLAQGIAQALLEEFCYSPEGIPLSTTFADYPVISAVELPSFETAHVETPSPLNDLGAKGIGEPGSIGSTPAVQNAIVDALSHLRVRHIDLPCTPERVWRAIESARTNAAQGTS